jgi:uncharacterized membrane protein (DUF4010 family)
MFSFTESLTTRDPRIFLELNITAFVVYYPVRYFKYHICDSAWNFWEMWEMLYEDKMINMSAMTTSPIEALAT